MIKGRGAQMNPMTRFDMVERGCFHAEGIDDWEQLPRKTGYIYDDTKSLVNKVTSPDVGMLYSANPYQGCEHGCVYCYARNTHEFWGYSAGLDFESRIVVKRNAPILLRRFFEHPKWQVQPISLSGNTDCYQPIERQMRITRQLLEVCLAYRNPVSILTKNSLVLRDLDLLQELSRLNLVSVMSSITSLDERVRQKMEPRTASYSSRLKVVEILASKNIPVGIMNAPIIPGLTDQDMPSVLKAASDAGASWAGYTIVRLNGAVAEVFKDWLYKSFPERADKVWQAIGACHGGSVSDSRWKNRMVGDGKFAEMIKAQFLLFCKKFGLNESKVNLETSLFRRPSTGQLSLF